MATLPIITCVLRTGAEGSETPQVIQLVIPRCESVTQPFEVVDEAGSPVDLDGYTIIASFGPQDGPATIEVEATIDPTPEDEPAPGTGSWDLTNAQTDIGPGVYFWDMEAIDSNDASSKIVLRSLVTFAGGVWRPAVE